MEEYGALGMVVEVGICVGQEIYLDLDDWWYLYAITTTRKKREAALPPACPMIASWAQPTGKRIAHTETYRLHVESTAALRFS
jgi:hypothetical protein